MATSRSTTEDAPLPKSFWAYLRSFGPGLIVVMTWLGAGDIVEVSLWGANYGYALMWLLVVAILMRFLFVSLIAKYQLCNPHGDGVLDGLGRLHWAYPPLLAVAAVVMGHLYNAYMTVGLGEVCANLTGRGQVWQWALLCNGVALAIVFRPVYARIEVVFKVLVAVLAASLLGTALWAGPSPSGILRGTLTLTMPEQVGPFEPLLIAVGMIGAVGGSLMNLVYPYFLEDKGWRRPAHRRVQMYDFLLAIVVMIVLDLALWTIGAELLHPRNLTIEKLDDLPRLLFDVLGERGRVLFYLGIFAAIFSSLLGHALGLARMGSHGYLRWRADASLNSTLVEDTASSSTLDEVDARALPYGRVSDLAEIPDYRTHRAYRWIVVWCLVSPLVWTIPGMPGFVKLTLVVNSLQVVLIPPLAIGLWWITASARYIGPQYRNRWWENAVMAVLLAIGIWAAIGSVRSVVSAVLGGG